MRWTLITLVLGIGMGIFFLDLSWAMKSKSPFGVASSEAPILKTVGATYFRPDDVYLHEWQRRAGKCKEECELARQSGHPLILTVRNAGSISKKGRGPSVPPRDMFQYRKNIAEILVSYKPELLVIENEEDSALSYYDGVKYGVWDSQDDKIDTLEKYKETLHTACDVAHKLNFRCTNGGISSGAVVLLTWANYIKLGKLDKACSFAKRTFYTRWNSEEGDRYCKVNSLDTIPPDLRKELAMKKSLLEAYRFSKIDYVNFHWYGRDAVAMREVVQYLRQATSKQVISNEIGQWSWEEDASFVQPILEMALKLDLPYVVWSNGFGTAGASLANQDGTLKPSGQAFLKFLQERGFQRKEKATVVVR